MRVEVWSDVVCPWCYLGKRRLETALAGFEYADQVEVVWRSFQLDPAHPKGARQPVYEVIAAKTGGSMAQVRAMTAQVTALAAEEGLSYDLEGATMANTFDAHRLTHLARAHGLGARTHERLMRAQLIEGEVLDDAETLLRLGTEVGLPPEETRRVLAGDAYAEDVADDIREAQALGANGVPFFVLDRRYGLSGAQPVETFREALRTAHQAAVPSR